MKRNKDIFYSAYVCTYARVLTRTYTHIYIYIYILKIFFNFFFKQHLYTECKKKGKRNQIRSVIERASLANKFTDAKLMINSIAA